MPHQLLENLKYKPTIYIFADPDGLGLSLIEHLLTNYCHVTVITSKTDDWKEKTEILKNNSNFKIISNEEKIDNFELSYSVYVDVYLNRNKKETLKAIDLNNNILGKKFVLFPFQVESSEDKNKLIQTKSMFINRNIDVEYLYVGDIIGPNINSLSYVYRIINLLAQGIVVKDSSFLYPILAKDIVKEISGNLFSFGPPTNEVALIGKETPVETLIYYLINNKLVSGQQLDSYDQKRLKVGNFAENVFQINFTYSIKETVGWLNKNQIFNTKPMVRVPKKKIPKNFEFPKIKLNLDYKNKFKVKWPKTKNIKIKKAGIFYGLFLVIFSLSLPLLIMLFSASLFILSFNSLEKGDKSLSIILFNLSKQTSILSTQSLKLLTNVPFVGLIYKRPYLISSLIEDGNSIAERGLNLYGILNELPSKILGNNLYSISTISGDVFLEFDSLYKEIGFLVSEVDSLEPSLKQTVYKYVPKERLSSLKKAVLFSRNITDNLEDILGSKEKRTYLVLFQNNIELRPTGGFIGSFALITFEGGRMTDINVQDVYSADGQLKGHVEPPNPIKQYLGEGGWYLRDANWNPDFPNSANKIEWFLDKEINQKVDGVFAIDLEIVKELLKVTGPIKLNDYNKTIDYKNMYEVTQFEVEDNFFPGSRNKSNYLTALSRELINTLVRNENINNLKIAKVFINGLEERHVQLLFHDTKVQKEISDLNFDGGVVAKNCLGNCFYNFISYVDANVGVNKANYFIERSSLLNVFLSDNAVTNVLRVTIKNNANPVLGDKVRYKSFLRALGLPGSKFEDIKLLEYGQENIIVPEIETLPNYKEAGLLVTINPGEEKTIEFIWSNEVIKGIDLYSKGEFGIYFRKQAGTINDKLSINLFLPNYMNIQPNSFFTLTGQGSYVYNTLLTRDIFPLIYW
jgi:hypothetical protein